MPSSITALPILCELPAAPAGAATKAGAKLTAPKAVALSAVGRYVQHYRRRAHPEAAGDHADAHADHLQLADAHHTAEAAAAAALAAGDGDLSDDEEETPALLKANPKEWKKLDLYAVLGLSKLRHLATLDDIIRQHRKKSLLHHPDKKASRGKLNDDAFYKCVQKAFEVLTDPVRRRQYESVDPGQPDDIPSPKATGDFFELYRPVFEREARFSNKQPVPELGDLSTSKAEFEAFYAFWFNFDSWRSFEFLDKDDVDNSDNRDHKRWLEKKNRAERTKRKTEDNARVLKLVDQAMKLDPRVQKFKEEEKTRRNAKKVAAEAEAKAAAEAKAKAEAEAAAAAAAAAAAEADAKAGAKKAKEAAKKLLRKEKKALTELVATSLPDVPASALEAVFAKHADGAALRALRTKLESYITAGNGAAAFAAL